jgi:regulatory protein
VNRDSRYDARQDDGPPAGPHDHAPEETPFVAEGDKPDDGKPDGRGARPRRKRPEPTPAQRALGLLVRREHSRKELTRKLAARGVEPDAASAAIDKLADAGWQDDSRFAEQLVRSRAAAGQGPLRIRAELATHGLSREAIATAMERHDGDWLDNARDLVRRRFGAIAADDRTARHKAADLLLRRGFTSDHVRAATRFDPDD